MQTTPSKNRNVVYSGKVGAKMNPRNFPARKTSTKKRYVCVDGPMRGHALFLTSHNTMYFTYKGQTGRYIDGKWMPQTGGQ